MRRSFFFTLFIIIAHSILAQKPFRYSSSEINQMIRKLDVLGNVMYIAAHPDDENTRLITYYSKGKLYNTYYFSFTRGDGGQNLIGPEIREELGVIRTQELIGARRKDGGTQLFSRANDFGYSKHPDETFNIWDKEEVLADLVWTIRKYKPDVLITRFNPVAGETHGHHTGSAMLAEWAFEAAGDPNRYPEQLKDVEVWQPRSVYWNAYWWRNSPYQKDTSMLVKVDVGQYNALLGKSYSEIAAESRSMHKSQGFGATGVRGKRLEYLQHVKGELCKNDVFENTKTDWARVEGSDQIQQKIGLIINNYDPENPNGSMVELIELRKLLTDLNDPFWKRIKLKEVDELIYACSGLYLEAVANEYSYNPGDSVKIKVEAINRSLSNISLDKVFVRPGKESLTELILANNKSKSIEIGVKLPNDIKYSQPYWLQQEGSKGMFMVSEQQLIGSDENDPALMVDFHLTVNGEPIKYSKPLVFKRNDPVKGESYKPVYIIPPVMVNLKDDVNVFANGGTKEVTISVRSGKNNLTGTLKLELENGWEVSPKEYEFAFENKYASNDFTFIVKAPASESEVMGKAIAVVDGVSYSISGKEIAYDHIPMQFVMKPAVSRFVKIDLQKKGTNIGYIMGAGDQIPEALRQIGYKVDLLDIENISADKLVDYDAIILGVRAFNTVPELQYKNKELFKYIENGGNLMVQYNTSFRLVTEEIAPIELKLGRGRVTVEEAEITFLDPDHPVLNYPNKITDRDFQSWVQERGLYFPSSWHTDFQPLFECKDPGESEALQGSTLVAQYGKGYYVYSSLSWFRELPAGVPGAYRIFTNLISVGK